MKFDQDIPMPFRPEMPFNEMETGDSFIACKSQARAAHPYAGRLGIKISMRKIDNDSNGKPQWRIWRVA